ncbi:hypothetical protein SAMN06265379_10472 [Saccharicrinis carchari]|uniref:Uncharacterized protein n=1 Tax=Saccharicrinis carchari TaxID=1168039 RepID=A0A521CZJ0_SACCC|nr:hypothetical protein SAMN06265379_10472 [Saccharicrinis carchari]
MRNSEQYKTNFDKGRVRINYVILLPAWLVIF